MLTTFMIIHETFILTHIAQKFEVASYTVEKVTNKNYIPHSNASKISHKINQ